VAALLSYRTATSVAAGPESSGLQQMGTEAPSDTSSGGLQEPPSEGGLAEPPSDGGLAEPPDATVASESAGALAEPPSGGLSEPPGAPTEAANTGASANAVVKPPAGTPASSARLPRPRRLRSARWAVSFWPPPTGN
jgi:hypothetical protein